MKKLVIPSVIAIAASMSFVKYKLPEAKLNIPEPSPENIIIEPTQSPSFRLKELVTGGSVSLSIVNGKNFTGQIELAQEAMNHNLQFGGVLTNDRGTFAISIEQDNTVSGVIMLPNKHKAYVLNKTPLNQPAVFEPADINTLVCHHNGFEHNMDLEAGAPGEAVTTSSLTTAVTVPVFTSNPRAKFHVYLDFDGEKVRDPLWNGGREIVALPQKFTQQQIREICEIVAERYSPFSINVTTEFKYYAEAPVNNRVRAIFTPTNNWRPGFGGIAIINSVKNAGKGVTSPSIPCWIFTNMLSRVRSVGECAAHEIGHTLGLLHDGAGRDTYYYGQGDWAPIMGSAYNRPVAQWSKGEYLNANNKQDDLQVILSNTGITPAEVVTVANTNINVNGIAVKGVIRNANDVSSYRVSFTTPGKVTARVNLPTHSALNVNLEVVDSTGKVVHSVNPARVLVVSTRFDVIPGVYTVKVSGAGEGDPRTTGYSAYGSVGTFTLTVTK